MDKSLREKVEWVALVFPRTVRAMRGGPVDGDQTTAGLTVPQWDALFALASQESFTLGELTKTLGVSQSSASELVDRLVRAGFIVREPKPGDRRAVSLRLSPTAHAAVERRKDELFTRFEQVLSLLPPAERDELLSAFERIFSLMQKLKEKMPTE